jgi:hypothetical protein
MAGRVIADCRGFRGLIHRAHLSAATLFTLGMYGRFMAVLARSMEEDTYHGEFCMGIREYFGGVEVDTVLVGRLPEPELD